MKDVTLISNNSDRRCMPETSTGSRQFDLFTSFFGDTSELSNTIELWDAIPKYAISARKQQHMRDENGRLPVWKDSFLYRPSGRNAYPGEVEIRVQPATVEIDGVDRDFYPSANEELLEEVLRKVFSDQHYGLHFVRESESWVRFTLYMVRQELQARGHTRSHEEIRRSLEIMGRCNIEARFKDAPNGRATVYSNPILSDMIRNGRDSYLADPKSQWGARLPALISSAINRIEYRQYNYGTFMALKTPIARWMHRRLSMNYTNASLSRSYHILFSSIEGESKRLQHSKQDRNLKTVRAMWQELKDAGVILSFYEIDGAGEYGNDIKFEVLPTPQFVDEVKAANARIRDSQAEMGNIDARKRLARARGSKEAARQASLSLDRDR